MHKRILVNAHEVAGGAVVLARFAISVPLAHPFDSFLSPCEIRQFEWHCGEEAAHILRGLLTIFSFVAKHAYVH